MKKTVFSVLALAALVASCKKDDDKSNADKIVGKWNQVNSIENDHYSGVDHKDTTTYPAGISIVEFTSNGKLYEKGPSYSDTANYRVDGSNLILSYPGNSSSDTLQIKALSGTDLTVYYKDLDTNGDFYESSSNFKKN